MAQRSFKERMKALTAMAESKAKAAASRGTSTKTVKDSKLWSLICLAREVAGDSDGIQDYAYLVDEKKRLECQLSEKSKEVIRLTEELAQHKVAAARENSLLTRTFGEQYKIFDQKNTALEKYRTGMESLKAELKTTKEKDTARYKQLITLESNAKSSNAANDRLQKRADVMERDCMIHRSQLQAAQVQRDKLESKLRADLGHDFFHDIDATREMTFREDLISLSELSYSIVKEFISDPEAAMTCTPLLQSLQTRFTCLPLPSGATQEAVLMRRAAGQAIISDALKTHVFRPFYIPDDFKDAADHMLEFFNVETEQQQIYRHQVISLLDDAEMESDADAAIDAGEAICSSLDRLVSPENVGEFCRRIEELSRRAVEIWSRQAQQASDIVEVTTPAAEDGQVESYPEFGVRNTGKNGTANHNIAATLFPRITSNGKVLHGGLVLWSDSPATMVARDQIPSPTLGRSGTSRKNGRRNSLVARSAA